MTVSTLVSGELHPPPLDGPLIPVHDRGEQVGAISLPLRPGAEPTPVVSRRQARADVTGPLAVVLDSPDVLWAGRAAINPVHRIGAPNEWQVHENRPAGRSEATGGMSGPPR